jgi:hypothetical protein
MFLGKCTLVEVHISCATLALLLYAHRLLCTIQPAVLTVLTLYTIILLLLIVVVHIMYLVLLVPGYIHIFH